MTTSTIKTIFNAALNLEIVVTDKSHDDILKEILAANGAMGRTSLRNLLSGLRPSVCGFTVVEKAVEVKKPEAAAPQIKKDEPASDLQPDLAADAPSPAPAPAAAAPVDQAKVDDAPALAPAPVVRPQAMNPWQQMMAHVNKAGTKVQAPDDSAATKDATGLKPVRRGTKIDLMLQALMTKGGVTFAELQKMLGWTEGAVSSYLHWEPQNKGYLVNRERGADGTLRYSLGFPKGVPNEILYTASAAAPAPAKA